MVEIMPSSYSKADQHQFKKTILSNGLRIITEAIPAVRSISIGVWVFTGSRDEAPSQSGINHFIEHMVFKGTKKRRMHQIARRLESVGGFINAFTGKEYTCYFARSLDEHLERAIDVVCDLISDPVFPEKELKKEKDVVLEEIKMYEDVPDDLIFDRFESVIYKGNPLGNPVIGFPETVKSFTRDQLTSYLNNCYTPERMVIAVAGNAEHDRVVRFVENAFENFDRNSLEGRIRSINGYEPDCVSEYRPIQQAHMVLGTRSYNMHSPERIVLSVLNTILGSGMSSRLNQNIREKYGYCYNIYSFMNLYSDTGDFGVYMGTDPAKVSHAEKLIFRELDKMVQKKVGKQLLNQAKNQLKGSLMLGLESMSNRMMRIARQELFYNEFHTLDEILENVERVNSDEILDVAGRVFNPDRFSRILLLPSTS